LAVGGSSGEYEFQQVPPRPYLLTVEAPGFKKYEAKNLQLQVDTPATLNVALEVGEMAETIAVSGETPLLNTVDASIGSVMTQNQVKELPLEGRNVAGLYALRPVSSIWEITPTLTKIRTHEVARSTARAATRATFCSMVSIPTIRPADLGSTFHRIQHPNIGDSKSQVIVHPILHTSQRVIFR